MFKDHGYICYRIPTKTAKWLEVRPWIFRHYHIKIPDRMYTPRSHRKLAEHYARLRDDNIKPDVHSDFSRLARMIRGCSVGLVLGGGGARGCSHVGMIKVNSFSNFESSCTFFCSSQFWRLVYPLTE